MSLRLRQFELRAVTPQGTFGVSIPLPPGLVVLRADNSSGKSTCLQGILYALGLEGMLSASHDVPMPHVVTDSLTDAESGQELPVLESFVAVEFENGRGEISTARRYARHSSVDRSLITVWDGPALTGSATVLRERSFFVRRPGAAQREAGFHHWFAKFLGWELPSVPRYDGKTSPLYLETVFPLFYVEQKRGWSGVQAQTPTHFRIRDVAQRNVEFVLALSGGEVAAERLRLAERLADTRGRWRNLVERFRSSANEAGITIQGLAIQPSAEWPPDPSPSLWLPSDEEWESLRLVVERLQGELDSLTQRVIPTAQESAPEVSQDLQRHLDELQEVSRVADSLHRQVDIEKDQVASLESRIVALSEDVRRSRDAQLLRQMGAFAAAVTPDDCPTCHQELPSTLLDPAAAIIAMPLDKNIQLLQEQIKLFDAMRRDLFVSVDAKAQQIATLDGRVRALQRSIRAERETLVSPSDAPSIEAVEARVHLRDRIEMLSLVTARLTTLNDALSDLAHDWTGLLADQARLDAITTPEDDDNKLGDLEVRFRDQLNQYGFTSVPTEQLRISRDTYLPEYEGFDLGFDLSASDLVRTIWAHRIGLLEVAEHHSNNHAGLLIFDEPRQQSTDPVSFAALFDRASNATQTGEQIIFATSEPDEQVKSMLSGTTHTYVPFAGKMIKRLPDGS